MERSRFERDGVTLSVARTGRGAAFLFQHGLCGAAGQPAEVYPDDSGFQCVTLECRGHGLSESGDASQFSISRFADDVAALAETCGAPLVIGGISMGAAIALRLAVTRPDLVKALVLARPAWVAEAGPANLAPNAEVGQLLASHAPAEARRLFEASPTHARLATEAPDNLTSLTGFFAREPIAVTSELLTRISADGPGVTRREIERIAVPALVIGHERDAIHPMAMAEELASLIASARLVRITPKATDVNRYRAEFRAAISTFLTENAR
jgi:pimeloyl-ACP methyl ester carboxylesterase